MISEAERENITRWGGGPGHYEVYYIKFNHRQSATACWIRYTLRVPYSGRAVAELWGIFFDAKDPAKTMAARNTFPLSKAEIERDRFLFKAGDAMIAQTRAIGTVRGREGTMRWDLRFEPMIRLFRHFPYDFMYRAGLPATKAVSPNFSIKVYGTFEINGRTYVCRGEPGQQTHLWGTRHADQWTWANCNSFRQDGSAVFEGLSARVKAGGIMSPALTLFFIRYRGKDYRLNGIARLLTNRSKAAFPVWELGGALGGTRFRGILGAPVKTFVGVEYIDPDGERLWCYNTGVADMELAVYEHGTRTATLTSEGTSSLEFGGRAMIPGISIRI